MSIFAGGTLQADIQARQNRSERQTPCGVELMKKASSISQSDSSRKGRSGLDSLCAAVQDAAPQARQRPLGRAWTGAGATIRHIWPWTPAGRSDAFLPFLMGLGDGSRRAKNGLRAPLSAPLPAGAFRFPQESRPVRVLYGLSAPSRPAPGQRFAQALPWLCRLRQSKGKARARRPCRWSRRPSPPPRRRLVDRVPLPGI